MTSKIIKRFNTESTTHSGQNWGFWGIKFLKKGDEGITASPRINHFVQNFKENPMAKSKLRAPSRNSSVFIDF